MVINSGLFDLGLRPMVSPRNDNAYDSSFKIAVPLDDCAGALSKDVRVELANGAPMLYICDVACDIS